MCNGTIVHGDLEYHFIALEECLPLVDDFIAKRVRWHSHVLSPGCSFNPFKDKYAIVVENDNARRAYVAPSDGFPEVDKEFVKRLHGDDILDEGKAESDPAKLAETSPMLRRLGEIDHRRIAWHHHMNFPDCALNPHPGRWAITVESDEGTFSESYEDEPTDILRAVEVLYFRNLASKTSA